MGILAIKAMAKIKLEEGVVNKYPKYQYEAIDDKELAKASFIISLVT